MRQKILKKRNKEHSPKKRRIIWASVTLAILAVIFGIFMYERAWLPLSVVELTGDVPDTPSQVQRMCRQSSEKFAAIAKEYPDCVFVWNGDEKIFAIRKEFLEDKKSTVDSNFVRVKFYNNKGVRTRGYIIDPVTRANELGTVEIENAEKLTFDSVSMSVRVSLRKGELSYKDAVYLWKGGSSEVLVVRSDAIKDPKALTVEFTDDGGDTAVYRVLDTKIR